MKILSATSFLLSVILSTSAFGAADIGPGTINVPTGENAVQTIPPDEKVKIQATRVPKRDTKNALVCTSADGAPKLADRVNEGSCRSHTKEHQAEAQKSTMPVTPTTDINAITGR